MMIRIFLLGLIFFSSLISETFAQSTFSIDKDSFIYRGAFLLDIMPPEIRDRLIIKNETSEDIEIGVKIIELRNSNPMEIDINIYSNSWNLSSIDDPLLVQGNFNEPVHIEIFNIPGGEPIPREYFLKLGFYDINDSLDIKEVVIHMILGDLTPGTGFTLDGSNSSQTFTPTINDWDNNVQINNNGNGVQGYDIVNSSPDDVLIGWEIESLIYPDEWEINNLAFIEGPSGHQPIFINPTETGQFWAWANGTYTFAHFLARIKHNRVAGSAVLRYKVYDVNDSLNYNEQFELSYHICHPKVMREEVVLDRNAALLCPGEALTLYADSLYSDIEWSTGQQGQSITTMADGNLTLTAKDDKGCTVVDTLELSVIRPYDEDICYVDVDPIAFHNTIYWYSTSDVHTKGYKLYKQTTQAGTYEEVFSEEYDGQHFHTDTDSDARVGSERYQLRTIDVCDNEFEAIKSHKTLHLTSNRGINGEINLIWEKYEGIEYSTFRILKGSSIDNMFLIAERPSNTFTYTDLNPNQAENFYRIEIDSEQFCTEIATSSSFPGSNVIYYQLSNIGNHGLAQSIILAPNPVQSNLALSEVGAYSKYIIYSELGQRTLEGVISSDDAMISVESIPKGTYFLRLIGDVDVYKTFIKQ